MSLRPWPSLPCATRSNLVPCIPSHRQFYSISPQKQQPHLKRTITMMTTTTNPRTGRVRNYWRLQDISDSTCPEHLATKSPETLPPQTSTTVPTPVPPATRGLVEQFFEFFACFFQSFFWRMDSPPSLERLLATVARAD